ncbi:tetratricopeptide repeat protein [Pseudomonas serbica]|uniref:tetratricopeptide repeat protein n=1 Tax=Pseudomonas serbica TaxID=2965074 RepID=UPI0039E40302
MTIENYELDFYNLPQLHEENFVETCFQLQKRNTLKPTNKLLIQPTDTIFDSLMDFSNQDIPNGRFRVWQSEAKFECLYDQKKNSEYLYVFLNGSRGETPDKFAPLPRFGRWSWHGLFNGSTLYIEDPMLYKYDDLNLGWYYGTKETSYLNLTLNIVKSISEKTGNPKVIFYGSSGGGYAALHLASMLPNSFAISINPQIELDKWGSASDFGRITEIDLLADDKHHRNSTAKKLIESNSKFLIIQNTLSLDDCKLHLFPLCKALDFFPDFGLSQKNNLLTWLYSTPAGHNSTDNKHILFFILELALNFFNKPEYKITALDNQRYKIASELWHDSFLLQDRQKTTSSHIKIDSTLAKDNFILSKQQAIAGRILEALQLARESVALDPTNITYKINLAELLRKNDLTEAAEEVLLQILINRPTNANAHFQLSVLCNINKNFDRASFHAQKAAEIEKTNINFRNHLTNILRTNKKFDEALESSQKAMLLAPDSGWAHVQLSRVLVDLKDFKLALKSAISAIEIDPNNAAFAKNLELVTKLQQF